MEAIACIDSAIWDLMGKAAGVNVPPARRLPAGTADHLHRRLL